MNTPSPQSSTASEQATASALAPTGAPADFYEDEIKAAHFDELSMMYQHDRERSLLAQLRDPDRAQSENELWAIASDNAGIRRELLRLSGRRVEE